MDSDGTISVTIMEAARMLSTTHLRVLMLVKQGVLDGVQRDGEWYVSRSSLDAFLADPAKAIVAENCRTSCTASTCGCKCGS